MPIYAYKCSHCQHSLDVLQKMSDAALTQCPQCGQPTLVKQLTAAGFQLKGSGWYATDFKNGPAKADAKPAAKAAEAGTDSAAAAPKEATAPAATPATPAAGTAPATPATGS